jgi:N-acyl-D-aspartate/D-glutamate deacylase
MSAEYRLRPGLQDQKCAGVATIDAIARQTDATGTDVMFDLIMTHENRVNIVAAGRSEADARRVLTHPLTVMGSDGIAGSVL